MADDATAMTHPAALTASDVRRCPLRLCDPDHYVVSADRQTLRCLCGNPDENRRIRIAHGITTRDRRWAATAQQYRQPAAIGYIKAPRLRPVNPPGASWLWRQRLMFGRRTS